MRNNTGSALILALSVIMVLVVLGTAGIIFARHERVESSDFLNTNNTTHAINAGIEEAMALAHAFSDPRRQLCLLNAGTPSSPTCNATSNFNININGEDLEVQLDFRNYNYPTNAQFTIRAPMPDFEQQTIITLDTNLNITGTNTTSH